jgi:AraC family transcriptional regulator
MVGGPEARRLREHAHEDLQISVHLARSASIRLTEPAQPHAGGWTSGERVAVMLLTPELIAETADDVIVRGPLGFRSADHSGDRLIRELAHAIVTEFSAPAFGANRRLYVESIGYTLAGHVVRTYADAPVRRFATDKLTGRQVQGLSDFVDSTLDQPVGVRDLASAVGLAPRAFADAFKRTMGQTPYQYVLHRRIDLAQRLLRSGQLPIVEVALRTGFANQSHFTSVFARLVGVSPARWRARS